MVSLNTKYSGILWVNVAALSLGVGFLVYKKWDNIGYGAGAGLAIGAVEYVFMRFSLARKQAREENNDN